MIGRTDGNWNSLKAKTKEQILAYIKTLNNSEREKLPSESKLSEMFGVSRVTIRTVLEDLVSEGRIIRKHGSGSYVNPVFNKIKAPLYPYEPFEKIIHDSGNKPHSRNMGITVLPASEHIAGELSLKPGDDVILSKHLFYADDLFCILCDDFIDARLLNKNDRLRLNTEISIIYKLLLERTGRSVAWDTIEITVTDTKKTPELGQYAEFSKDSLKSFLLMETTGYDTNGLPLIYSDIYYDTDYFKFGMVRKQRIDFEEYVSEKLPPKL